MTLRTPPLWLQNGVHPAENDRLGLQGLVGTEGVGAGTDELAVTQTTTPAMQVSIAAGWAWVLGSTTSSQGMYSTYNDAPVTLAIATADPTNGRIDRVCLTIQDSEYAGSTNTCVLQVVTGTPSGTPAPPAEPASSITLALVTVDAGKTTVTNADISDQRPRAELSLAGSPEWGEIGGTLSNQSDLQSALDDKVDYATPTNIQAGTTYTFVLGDGQLITTATNAAAKTFTVPPQSSVDWPANTILRVINYGAGALTVNGGAGVTVTNTATTLAQYESGAAIRTGSDAWTFVPFSGGVGDADFSNTATGTYTDNGVDYKYVTFTASGTLTVTREGTADVLIIGGGGGVTAVSGMGGGQGGNVLSGRIFLTAASHTVTVGGGGSGSSLTVGGTTYTANAGSNGNAQYPGNSSTPNAYVDISGVGGASGGLGGGFSGQAGGAGGRGVKTEITNSTQTLAGGGGGGSGGGGGAAGAGSYGGGNGGENGVQNPTNGSANTGGGGGGAGAGQSVNTSGGSGIVIVRVKV